MAILRAIDKGGTEFVVCANTIVEVMHARVNLPRLQWALSQVQVEPVTEESAKAAVRLLKDTGLHGHKYAIDATVAEMALRQPGPVVMLTSDLDDMARLCGGRVRLVGV
nr:DNA-binding protein [Streptomyces sp. ISL-1]